MVVEKVDVADIPSLGHDEAMAVAAVEYGRFLEVVDRLGRDDWAADTDNEAWAVKDVVAHLLGWMKANADPAEAGRQVAVAAREAQERGILRLHAQTALHVREHAHLSPAELAAAVHEWSDRALEGRTRATAEQRALTFLTGLPGEPDWTRGYLVDVVFTRDMWMHRIDLCRATGQAMRATPDHDGRIVADVVGDWARRHGRPFTLRLGGPAGGVFTSGQGGPEMRHDAVEFCRILSGRGSREGLLSTFVPF